MNDAALASRAVPLFLLGTFGWAWGLWGYWVLAMPSGGLRISAAFLACALAGGLAPSLAAIAASWITGGRTGIATLLRPLTFWHQPRGVYAFALGVPAATVAMTLAQLAAGAVMRWPDPSLMAMALVWPLAAALGEEIGWRGLLLPSLERRLGLLPAALLVGIVWGLWHLPADYIALKGYGALFPLAFLINGPVVLTAHSIIMAWLWRKTRGSLLLAVLYHWSITASAILTPATGGENWDGLASSAVNAATIWAIAIVLWLARRNDF